MLSHVLEPRRGVRPHQTIVRAENFDRDRIHLDPPFLPRSFPISDVKLSPDIEQPYWKRPIYKVHWPYRNNFNYDNYVTDPFHWNHLCKKWQNYRQNWYFYDDPEYYRKYRASYPGYFELGVKGSRSRLLEDIYLSDR